MTAPVTPATLGPGYFDAMYEAAPDPWASRTASTGGANTPSASRSYPDRRYRSAFEPGCTIGVLTAPSAC